MSEKVMPFVVTDRRKFTMDGETRPEYEAGREQREKEAAEERERLAALPATPADGNEESSARLLPETESTAPEIAERLEPAHASAPEESAPDSPAEYPDDMPPPPTADQMQQSKLAYDATAERLETAIRAANPGMDHPPAMNFENLVQSVYMTAIVQLGGSTQEGQQPRVDLMGARQSIDMLTVVAEKSVGNLSPDQIRLIDSALFELRMGFLEITQALARQAQAKNPGGFGGPGGPGTPRPGFGPSIVR
jgi:hypothetical protein